MIFKIAVDIFDAIPNKVSAIGAITNKIRKV